MSFVTIDCVNKRNLNLIVGDMGAAPVPPAGWVVLDSTNAPFSVSLTVLDSTGAPFVVPSSVLDSTGASFTPI